VCRSPTADKLANVKASHARAKKRMIRDLGLERAKAASSGDEKPPPGP
jgi:hypothetical protein